MRIFAILSLIIISGLVFSGYTKLLKKNQTANTRAESRVTTQINQTDKYISYSQEKIQAELDKGQRVLLFFHATWCPTCQSAEEDILSRIDEVPDDLTVIKIDYDSNKELRKKYNVSYQHTFVQLDQNSEVVTQWSGGELDLILQIIKQDD